MCSASFLLESRAVLEIVTALWFQGQQKSKEPHPGRERRPSTLFCILNDVLGSPNVYELYFSQLDIKTSQHTITEFPGCVILNADVGGGRHVQRESQGQSASGEMTQWVKTSAAKPVNLSLIPGTRTALPSCPLAFRQEPPICYSIHELT